MRNSNHVDGGAKGATVKGGAANKAAQDNINVMVFENSEFGPVRTFKDKNGEVFFCGKDVCKALGYAKTDKAVREHVNPSDVLKRYLRVGSMRAGKPIFQMRMMLFVNESGVYSLVFGSKLESAQRFKHWVTSVVLPAIRKNGGYFHINPGETVEQIKVRFERVLKEALAERDKLIAEQVTRIRQLDKTVGDQVVKIQKSAENIEALESDVSRMLPKELYVDNVLDSISCYTTTQIAKELGCTAQELNRSLCASHIQYYQSGQYLLYADYAHMGLAKSRTGFGMRERDIKCSLGDAERSMRVGDVYTHTYLVWTERGRKFIHDLATRLLDETRQTHKA